MLVLAGPTRGSLFYQRDLLTFSSLVGPFLTGLKHLSLVIGICDLRPDKSIIFINKNLNGFRSSD